MSECTSPSGGAPTEVRVSKLPSGVPDESTGQNQNSGHETTHEMMERIARRSRP